MIRRHLASRRGWPHAELESLEATPCLTHDRRMPPRSPRHVWHLRGKLVRSSFFGHEDFGEKSRLDHVIVGAVIGQVNHDLIWTVVGGLP